MNLKSTRIEIGISVGVLLQEFKWETIKDKNKEVDLEMSKKNP